MGCNTWRFPQGMVMVCIENGEDNNYDEDNHYGNVMFCNSDYYRYTRVYSGA